MKRKEMWKPLKSATDLLKTCTTIGTIGTVGAIGLFIMTCFGDPREKMLTMTGVLTVLVFLYTLLSNRAYRTAASGTVPRMRYLVALTLFNLLVLGFPLSWFGFMAMLFGFGTIGDMPVVASGLIFLALCAVLFFISHIMTLVAARKMRGVVTVTE